VCFKSKVYREKRKYWQLCGSSNIEISKFSKKFLSKIAVKMKSGYLFHDATGQWRHFKNQAEKRCSMILLIQISHAMHPYRPLHFTLVWNRIQNERMKFFSLFGSKLRMRDYYTGIAIWKIFSQMFTRIFHSKFQVNWYWSPFIFCVAISKCRIKCKMAWVVKKGRYKSS
jgi:hypothetical protein